MATFKITLDTRIKVGNDSYHLTVRLSDKKEVVYLRIGVLMTKKEYEAIFKKKSFDPKLEEVKKSYHQYVERAEKLFPLIQPFQVSKFRELYFDLSYDPDSVNTPEKIQSGYIKFMYDNYVKIKVENSQIAESTGDLYKYNMRSLLKFKPDLTYQQITPEFLSAFENWFLNKVKGTGKKNSLATVGNICRSLRSVLNYYKKKKIIPPTYDYPFLDYKVPNYTPPKMVISNQEIESIINCSKFDDPWEEYARDIWVLLYRLNGINFIDLLILRWDHIHGNHLVFTRRKTQKTKRNNIRPLKIKISPKIQVIIDKIGNRDSKFIIGQINDENYDETYLKNRNHKLKGKINSNLKKVGKRLNLSMSLDISLARDAYANTLKRANVNVLKISENMNHSDPRTTTLHYLDQFDQDTLDDANDAVL